MPSENSHTYQAVVVKYRGMIIFLKEFNVSDGEFLTQEDFSITLEEPRYYP